MSAPLNYDPKCEELARHFLGEDANDALVRALAEAFQWQVELFTGAIEDDDVASAAEVGIQ
jgi:hypothetical protein